MSIIEKIKSNKLVKQILGFGVVGILAFVVEMVFLNIFKALLPILIKGLEADTYTLVAAPIAFLISLLFNYVMSMKFVFTKRQDANEGQVFVIFLILNLIALGLNQLFMWILVNALPIGNSVLKANVAKIIATFLVMVYNFISRKIFIEDHSDKENHEK